MKSDRNDNDYTSMTGIMDRWLQVSELAKLFGLSEESIKRLAKSHGLPLRRLTPYATPGALESELIPWLKAQPLVGHPIRRNRRMKLRNMNRKMNKG